MTEEARSASWSDRVFGGFRKTSERLTDNLAGIVAKTRLTDSQLDDIEDALIVSDLGPRAAARIRDRLAEERFERDADERGDHDDRTEGQDHHDLDTFNAVFIPFEAAGLVHECGELRFEVLHDHSL